MKNLFYKKGFVLLTAAVFVLGGFFVANTAKAEGSICAVPGDYETIQAAVNDVSCTTINVAPETYNESLNITNPVILQSTGGRDVTTIKSLTIATSSVTVSGFTIEGVNASNVASANIFLNSGVSNITISNNKINVGPAINYDDTEVGLLTTSNLDNIGDNLNVTGNIFQASNTGSSRAFYINPGIDHFTFSENTITGNFAYTATTSAKNGLVENNTITGAGAVGDRSAGFRALGEPDPTVWGHTTFSGNTVSGVKRGITVDEANNVTITGNNLSGNEIGVRVVAYTSLPFDITTISVHNNNLSGEDIDGYGVTNNEIATPTNVDVSSNWWGSANGPQHISNTFNVGSQGSVVSDNVNFAPWLNDGTDTVPATPGFQPANGTSFAPVMTTDPAGSFASIKAAINTSNPGGTINVAAGTYDEQVVIDGKDLTLQGAGDTTIIQPSAPTILTSTYLFPAGNFWAGATTASIIIVKNASAVTLKDFKVDGINVSSLPLAGSPDRLVGVLFGESSGTIDNVTVNNIKTTGHADRTYGIEASGASTGTYSVEVKNSHVNDWDRNGIVADGLNLTANINHNTLVGPGTISGQVANGILFIGGVSGNATSNIISGMHHNSDWSRSAGIMVYGATTAGILIDSNDIFDTDDGVDLSASSHNITVSQNNLHDNLETGVHLEWGAANNVITNNTITNNAIAGIRFAGANDSVCVDLSGAALTSCQDDPPGIGNVAHNNSFSGNGFGVVDWDVQTFDATNNWWGSAVLADVTAKITGSVTYDPWYTNAGMTTLNTYTDISVLPTDNDQALLPLGVTDVILNDTTVLNLSNAITSTDSTVTIDGNIVALTQEVTLQSGTNGEPVVLTNSNLTDVSVSIPDETKISGPAGWDGTITPPTDAPSDGTAPAGFSVGSIVINVGSPAGTLVFDKAVTILLEGVTGTVAYRPALSDTWITIDTTCTGTYDDPTGAVFPGECKITDGTNTKILTFHFTSFGELNVFSSNGGSNYTPPADTTPPSATSVSINAGAASTSSLSATLTLAATDATQMIVSNDAGFTGASWESYATSKVWTLTSGDGVKTVYAKFRDATLNMSEAISDTITVSGTGIVAVVSNEPTQGCSAGNLYNTSTGALCVNNTVNPAGKVLGASTGPILGCGNRTTGFSVATGESCALNISPSGQVLGAASFNFTKFLKNNSKGNEVIELQKFLNNLGHSCGTADGKFGPKTKACVVKFQVANKLKADGIVGPKVRALLNQ